jgi:ubiquinone/menaquinone biosynthesis C-methylase UbiE
MHTHSHHQHNRANMYGLARHAASYDRHAGLLARPLYRRVAADVAAARLPAAAVVLDVGTGPGRVPRLIADKCPELTVEAIDLSPEMIAQATSAGQAAKSPNVKRIRFQVADVAALPFADGSVDLVVSSISMHHWDDPVAGFRDVVRVLKPGGRAWIYDFRPPLHRLEPIARELDADTSVESPLVGTFWFNPIGRLVLRRTGR